MCEMCQKAAEAKAASGPEITGSQLREKINPKLESALAESIDGTVANENMARRVVRAFLRFAAKQAAARGVEEGLFMDEAHRAFHEEA